MLRWCTFWLLVGMAAPAAADFGQLSRAEPLRVALGEIDITPDLAAGRPVWIAGYGHNRPAQGVHDPLMARCVALDDGQRRIALVSVDLVGLQYPEVLRIRARLADWHYVLVASTHNHEGPDVIGLWGPAPIFSGVDPQYLAYVVEQVVKLVEETGGRLEPAAARYGTAEDATLLGDSRLPKVYDGVLRALRFDRPDGTPLGILVQWNCHPESLGSRNRQLTADFPWATVAALRQQYGCPVAYFSGAVGGLMGPPDDRVRDATGNLLADGDFEYARVYGELVADLASQALDGSQSLELTPIAVSARPIVVPLENPLYHAGRLIGVLKRDGRRWTGDFEALGEVAGPQAEGPVGVETEVAYLRLGDLHVALVPGELYPELVYGQFQEPVEPNVDHPDAPLETPVMKLLPGEKTLLLGLANDEIGYIVPRRQWDERPPFAYGRDEPQYGEINSVGPQAAPILMEALERRVREAGQ